MKLLGKIVRLGNRPETMVADSRAVNASIADGAIDTLGYVFRTMGDISFPLADEDNPDTFRELCGEFACHVENGGPIQTLDIAQTPGGDRQWGHVRRFFIDRRSDEREFVTDRLGNYRDIVEELIKNLRNNGHRDQHFEKEIQSDLNSIEFAVDAGGLPEIKTALSLTVQNITETFAAQRQEYESQIRDLNERMSSLRQDMVVMREEMKRDPLTETFNRGAFDTAIVQSLNMRFILDQPSTVIMIDLDAFKDINDDYGHSAGDDVLRSVGECLSRSFIRKGDIAARYGGDEFAVILSDTTALNSASLIDRFMERIDQIRIPYANDGAGITCSVGYTEIHHDDSVEVLVRRADAALYEAKAAGRNCCKYAPPPEDRERRDITSGP